MTFFRRSVLLVIAVIILHSSHPCPFAAGDEPAATVDPFAEKERAEKLLLGTWQYSAEFTKEVQHPRYAATYDGGVAPVTTYQPVGSRPAYQPGVGSQPSPYQPLPQLSPSVPSSNQPFTQPPTNPQPVLPALQPAPSTPQPVAPPPNSQPTPAVTKQKLSSSFRLDLQEKNKFRMELLLVNHSDKSCDYAFLEGTWKLRGRLLVLHYSELGPGDQWAFLIERLTDQETNIRAIGTTSELLADGRGALEKPGKLAPLDIPEGYEVEADFGVAEACPTMQPASYSTPVY